MVNPSKPLLARGPSASTPLPCLLGSSDPALSVFLRSRGANAELLASPQLLPRSPSCPRTPSSTTSPLLPLPHRLPLLPPPGDPGAFSSLDLSPLSPPQSERPPTQLTVFPILLPLPFPPPALALLSLLFWSN